MAGTRARACEGKRAHATRRKAKEALQRMAEATGTAVQRLNVYQCKHAPAGQEHWHVGHVGRRAVDRG